MNAFSWKSIVLGAACASMMVAGSTATLAQPTSSASDLRCDRKPVAEREACREAARAASADGSNPGYASSSARPVGSIVIPGVAAAAALGLAIALASSGKGRGPIPVISP